MINSYDGTQFFIKDVRHNNPNIFLRNYALKKLGPDYLKRTVIESEDNKSGRSNASVEVVEDLKSKISN